MQSVFTINIAMLQALQIVVCFFKVLYIAKITSISILQCYKLLQVFFKILNSEKLIPNLISPHYLSKVLRNS